MSFTRDAETERVLAESKRLRGRLTAAVAELDAYVQQLHDYVETLNRTEGDDGERGPRHAGEPG